MTAQTATIKMATYVRGTNLFVDGVQTSSSLDGPRYTIKGEPGKAFKVTLSMTSDMASTVNPTDILPVLLTYHLGANNTPVLNAVGEKRLFVSAALTVPASALGGTYAGGFTVTVEYDETNP